MSTQMIPTEAEQAIDDNTFDFAEKYIAMAGLPRIRSAILRTEMLDYMSESPSMSAQQIADHVGCSVESVYVAHRDVRYKVAKSHIQDMWFQGMAGNVYKAVLDTAMAGKVGAQKLALEVMGKHVTRVETRNVNLNADILSDQTVDMDSAVDRFLIMLGTKGWSLDMLADKWRTLKNQQAF